MAQPDGSIRGRFTDERMDIGFAALTSNVHFVQLTAVRQMGSKDVAGLSAIHLYPWPSGQVAVYGVPPIGSDGPIPASGTRRKERAA